MGRLDGFSIGRYEKNRESFDLYAIIWNSQRRTQIHSKSLKKTTFEAKGRLYTTAKVIQRLFIIDLYT